MTGQRMLRHPARGRKVPSQEGGWMISAGQVAAAAGVGLAAGLAGAAAMAVSSTIEMKIRGRAGSSAPADAAGKLLGVRPAGKKESKRFGALARWAYGTGWGAARGALAALGMPVPAATAAHLALVRGTGQVMLPALQAAPPAPQWGGKELAIDGWHHLVYAGVTAAASELPGHAR
jgi:hypothetical protein